jgi:hypothetical protein
MPGLHKKKHKNQSQSATHTGSAPARSLFKHGIERARRVFGHRESGSATATTHDAAPIVGGHLDPHKLIELTGGAEHAGEYKALFNQWYTDLGIFMDARNAATTTPQGKRDLEVTMLHHLYKAAVGETGRAERLQRQITPFLDQSARYHRSTENKLIDQVTVAFEASLGVRSRNAPPPVQSPSTTPAANPAFERVAPSGPLGGGPPRMPTSQLHLIHNATFDKVIQRELNTQDLVPDTTVDSKATFESKIDHLLEQVAARQTTTPVDDRTESTGDRTFFDVTTMFTQQLGEQTPKDGAASTINDIAATLQDSFKDRLATFLDGKSTDDTFNAADFTTKLSRVVTGMQIGAFTSHEGQDLLLTPHFFTDAPAMTEAEQAVMGSAFSPSNLQKQSRFNSTLTTTLKESGFRPDPVQAKESWLKVKDFDEILQEQKIPTVRQGVYSPPIAQPDSAPLATAPLAATPPADSPPADVDAITPIATTPSTAAPFATVDDFRATTAFTAFSNLAQDRPPADPPMKAPPKQLNPFKPTISQPDGDLWKGSPPPYLKVLTEATTAALNGLDSRAVTDAFHAKGLDDLLPKILYRITSAMGEASFQQQNQTKFLNQIDLIHSHLSAILKITDPDAGGTAFQDGLLGFLNKDTIPADLQDSARANVYPSAIHTVATTLASVAAQKGDPTQSLNVAVLKDSYYESATAISRSKTYTVFDVAKSSDPAGPGFTINHKQGGPAESSESGPSTTDGKNLDVYLAEFQHNISGDRGSYGMEDVKGQVDQIFSEGRAGKSFTVVIDNTIDRLKSDALTDFLAHNKDRIDDGSLNVVLFKSAQKFDMLGVDNYYGGYAVTVNNGSDYEAFNGRMNVPRDQLQGLNRQGLTHLVTHAPEGLDAYRAGIIANTQAIYDGLSPGLAANTSTPTPGSAPATLKISTIEPGSKQVFLDIKVSGALANDARDGFLSAFTRFRDARGLGVDNRPSFGFAMSNLMFIDGIGIRFNPGLEGAQAIADYATFLNQAHAIFTKPRDPGLDPRATTRQIVAELQQIEPDAAPRRAPWMPSFRR